LEFVHEATWSRVGKIIYGTVLPTIDDMKKSSDKWLGCITCRSEGV
jgi:hypothetical protein